MLLGLGIVVRLCQKENGDVLKRAFSLQPQNYRHPMAKIARRGVAGPGGKRSRRFWN